MQASDSPIRVKPAVVIVEDDPAVCNSLKFSLEIEGFAVRLFPGAAEILREADLSGYRCLVIDYKMPGMNGLDLLSRLRERKVTAPAILITSNPDAAIRSRAATAGVPIVEKPFLGNVLVDAIQVALAQTGDNRAK